MSTNLKKFSRDTDAWMAYVERYEKRRKKDIANNDSLGIDDPIDIEQERIEAERFEEDNV